MAILPGTRVIQPIVPNDSRDEYPTHHDHYGQGGYRAVPNLIERDNIPLYRQKLGMAAYVVDEQKLYILINTCETLDDSCWDEIISAESGSVIVSPIAPANPTEGMIWLDSTTGKSYIYTDLIWENFIYNSQMLDDNGELILNGGYF